MRIRVLDWPIGTTAVLALGGWSKTTICAVSGQNAFVSEPIGNLDEGATCQALEQKIEWMCARHYVEPVVIAHDLHPDFFSTRLAQQMAGSRGIATLGVQHHHAHIAAVCAEHGVTGTVLGLAMDGFGMGSDGQAWGGELLRVGPFGFDRIGHVLPLRLPGGTAQPDNPGVWLLRRWLVWVAKAKFPSVLPTNQPLEPWQRCSSADSTVHHQPVLAACSMRLLAF